jgi:hypothetical protein
MTTVFAPHVDALIVVPAALRRVDAVADETMSLFWSAIRGCTW